MKPARFTCTSCASKVLHSTVSRISLLPQGVKASFAFFFASLVTKGIAYVTTPVYTRLLTPDEFGQANVFLTWLHLLGLVAMFCLYCGVFNNGMVDYPDRRDEYSLSMLGLANLITLVFSSIMLCIYPFLRKWMGMDYPLVILMCVVFLFQPGYSFWMSRQRYELKWKGSTFWTVFSSFLSPVVALVAILAFPAHRLHARLFGAEGALAVIYAGFCLHIALKNRFRVNTAFWRQAFFFNLPLIPHYLSAYLLSSSDKLMISRMIGDAATAYYSVAHSVAFVVLVVWTAAHASLIPFIYENCKTKNYSTISKVTLPILAVFDATCILLILLAPEAIALMATRDYREAIYVVPPVVAGVFFQVHYFLYADVLYYYKKPRYVMYGSIAAASANIALNWLFIPRFGYIAAAWTTLVCYLLQAAIDYWAMRRVIREKIYDMRLVALLSVLLCAIAFICLFVYDTPAIRYALLGLLLLALFLLRDKVIHILTAFKTPRAPRHGSA